MSIDFTKPLQTRNGRKLRLLCTGAPGDYPVICLREDDKVLMSFTLDGALYKWEPANHPSNLMNVPEEVTVDVWVNVYLQTGTNAKPQIGLTYRTRGDAVEARTKSNAVTFHIKRTVPVGHVDE